ncbi:uncharacterized protein si:ch73-95l15.5 [Carcharodon carcharias]|uniref:uncharacterized protein si:ch73-95l15.5 n=1 Tax=Carcharodon carcharias TaxID=13397 RepID=UPI001B7EA7D5|nr:uncharacterized protein si:ch73-95l15.5 [Carcharodon carcharias]
MKEQCRVCASELKGNQRRWIFSSRAAVNLQVVLSHVLGQKVTRDGQGEFLCGKCTFSLERVYRFDTVIARVQALSIEKIQRLLTEKDRLAQCLCYLHGQHHPPAKGLCYKGQDITVDIADLPHVQYNTLLQDDLAMSEYECWSEQSGSELNACSCQHRNCSGCSALLVSDSTYESVCKIPRRLARALSKGHLSQLSKSKSRSMPLDWLQTPERRVSSSSSVQSLYTDSSQPSSRSTSISSLGAVPSSVKGSEDLVFDDSLSQSSTLDQSLAAVLQWMRGVVYRPVHTLPGSKIPVRIWSSSRITSSSPVTPQRQLSYGGDEESFRELRSEFSVEYLPFNLEKFHKHEAKRDGLQQTVGQLSEQLEVARSCIQSLEAQIKEKERVSHQQELRLQTGTKSSLGDQSCQNQMIQRLICELHSKEQLLQECVELISQLTRGTRSVSDTEADMVGTLRMRLKDRDKALQQSADEKFTAIEEEEAEIGQLRSALREKDQDVNRLSELLANNEELINMLNHTLKKKHAAVEQLETLCTSLKELSSQRDEKRVCALREKDSIISQLQAALQNRAKDVEALTDSLLSQGLSEGSDSSARLCLRLKDKERLLSQALVEQDRQATEQVKAIEELLNSIGRKDQVIKEISDRHMETLAVHTQEAHALKQQLSAKAKELDKLAKLDSTAAQECFIELAHLKMLLDDKDQLIVNLLDDGKARDQVLLCLQDQLRDSVLLKVGVKQTL